MSRVSYGVACIALLIGVAGAQAQQQRPTIETKKIEGTENVYLFRNQNAQSIFIVTNDGVIATDPVAYGKPTGGQAYVDEIRKVTDPMLIIEKNNFQRTGTFRYELYQDRVLVEKGTFMIKNDEFR